MDLNTESQAYPFTPAEFERLAAFRQAVLAGFYTDELDDDEADRSLEVGAAGWSLGQLKVDSFDA
jgi:hypothetical protein